MRVGFIHPSLESVGAERSIASIVSNAILAESDLRSWLARAPAERVKLVTIAQTVEGYESRLPSQVAAR